MEELLKKIKELGGEDLATEVQAEITKRNNEAKENRTKKTELSDLIKEVMETVGVDKKEELKSKVTTSTNELKMLADKVAELEGKNTEAETKQKKAERESKITDVLVKKKIKKRFDFTKKALIGMVEDGETGLLVGTQSLEDYVQTLIDEDPTVVESKKTKETQKSNGDLYSEAELANLSEEEVAANEEKVNNSLAAL